VFLLNKFLFIFKTPINICTTLVRDFICLVFLYAKENILNKNTKDWGTYNPINGNTTDVKLHFSGPTLKDK